MCSTSHTERWGRLYPKFGQGRYMLPADETECDRLDIFHKFFSIVRARDDSPFPGLCSHLPSSSHLKILDLGCGTGLWAIDMADGLIGQGRTYDIEGWDLSYMQPLQIPPAVLFRQKDMEVSWDSTGLDSFDLIHMRMLSGSIRRWDRLYNNTFRHMKAGSGLLEQVEVDWRPRSDVNESLMRETSLCEWSDKLQEGFDRAGMPLDLAMNREDLMRHAGFVDIEHREVIVPLNRWPATEELRNIARWFHLGFTQGLEALTLKPLIQWLDIPEQDVRDLIDRVKNDSCRRQLRPYCILHIWIARKPLPPHPN
ncbi:methyltransferase LaeA [Xylariaceae sp. FL0255]|nr:methyltransferase LaeA [Xylariaceae sp. FL0255]